MIKYVNVLWSGKGFITHDDCKVLKFEYYENVMKITGEEDDVDAWVERVGGTIMPETDALEYIKIYKLAGWRLRLKKKYRNTKFNF